MIDAEENKEYLPIEGLADFNKATAELLLGADNAAIREVAARAGAHATLSRVSTSHRARILAY
jgi:aspartate aminotransferase